MDTKLLLVTPPFTQLNTPYPATAYLKGYLNTKGINSLQLDLGIETIFKIFSQQGLSRIFQLARKNIKHGSTNTQRIYALKDQYINAIDSAIQFLQDKDPTLAHFISERKLFPESSKFQQLEDLDWAFGSMGIRDQARHITTLFLEDISDFIVELIDPHFGFSRYAEKLGSSANSFDDLYTSLCAESSFVVDTMWSILEKNIIRFKPSLICFTVPFPGNLFAALKCGQLIKNHFPNIPIAMGGGYPNTELRSLKEARVFEFVDYITLDDGETPLWNLMEYLNNRIDKSMLKRTFTLIDNQVKFLNGSLLPDVKQADVGTPDYADLPLRKYLSVIQLTNPMHRLWSDGRWNKLTMAHGCYWGKCTFCDISLDYINNYEANTAVTIVDRMQELILNTGESGFHFVDEAAPPALMKSIALEILKRNLLVSWWTNIRFEKSFSFDLCRLLSASGCIAVSGGLEVAADRLLNLIAKGVSIEQVSKVTSNLIESGIMVHAYLMYGFPTQTDQETIDSLEVVRQMFENGILQSAYWHRFAMTAHSPVGLNPEEFNVSKINETLGEFANNDLEYRDESGCDSSLYDQGLKKSLYNYMHGLCIDDPLQNWFDHNIPTTSHSPNLIESYLSQPDVRESKDNNRLIWINGAARYNLQKGQLEIVTKQEDHQIPCSQKEGMWIEQILNDIHPASNQQINFKKFKESYTDSGLEDFTLFWFGDVMESVKALGLLIV